MKLQKLFVLLISLFIFILCCMNVGMLHAKEPIYKWKFATLAPDGVGWLNLIKEIFIPVIDKVTNGDVALE